MAKSSVPVVGMSERRRRDQLANLDALNELFELDWDIRTVVDIRYGLGSWAQLVENASDSIKVWGFEMDPDTAKAAYKPRGRLVVRKYRDGEKLPKDFPTFPDVLLADFSDVTMKNRYHLESALAAIQPKEVIFTDVAIGKLHLNYRSYGMREYDREKSLDRYWKGFLIDGYRIMGWEKASPRASLAKYRQGEVE